MNTKQSMKLNRRAKQNLTLLVVLIALLAFFTIMNPRFFSNRNFINIARQMLPTIMMGCTMTFIINSGAIDLSVGGIMGFSAVIFGYLCGWGINPWLAVVMVAVIGGLVGCLNTFIIQGLKLPPIMATMATWIAFAGIGYTMCSAIPVKNPEIKAVSILNSTMFFDKKVPLAFFIMIIVVALFLFIEKKTIIGKYSIAIGGNENAAHFSGINVYKMRLIIYMMSGLMAALAGIWQVARVGSGDPTIGSGMEFTVIAGCILGGVSIKGGDGTITGMLIGTVILAILTNGMNMMGVNSFYQQVATGVVILVAVLINFTTDYLGRKSKENAIKA